MTLLVNMSWSTAISGDHGLIILLLGKQENLLGEQENKLKKRFE